mmetsp:Transcript_45626/g.83550  ORF Transcript_45626/g.83550 Transcript_45626/m.83550 type:complete len:131 (+) Transcript_45626:74-466(+)
MGMYAAIVISGLLLQAAQASRPEVHPSGLIQSHTAEVNNTGDGPFSGTKAKHPELVESVTALKEATSTAGEKAEEVAEKMAGYHDVIKELGQVLPEASKQAKALHESLWKELSDKEEERTKALKASLNES